MAHGKHNKKAEPYAQNPYGGMYATQNKREFDEHMPKQGFKSDTELDEELSGEHKARMKGKTLLTTGLTY